VSDTTAEAAIEVEGLSKSFGGKAAVQSLALKVKRGEIFGFLGPNGSGKTTSIRMLCGLLTPDDGQGRCLGYDVRTQSSQIKAEVGYMPQRFGLYEDLTIRENLEFVASIYAVRNAREAANKTLAQLGLSTRAEQLAGGLSGGWKQRLALAACLMHEPRLLLLDEPTAGVDPNARREFWDEIHRLAARGITVLVSTHYMDEAERCHRLAYIFNGRLLAQGTSAELVARSGLSTWVVEGEAVPELREALRGIPAAEQVVVFGTSLHVSSANAEALERALAPFHDWPGLRWMRGDPRLEDVFIHLMRASPVAA
jgi:ABC-2 type transport system ATP-binding protein